MQSSAPCVTVSPESVGLSSVRLARIDQHLERRYLAPGKIAGALTLVSRGGEVVWLSPLGLRDRERGLPMTEDTIFRIYSMTKPITSVAVMTLYEEGHFQLDDPVGRFLPELAAPQVFVGGTDGGFLTRPVTRPITVRDLLLHTSGLTYGFMEATNVDAAYRARRIGERWEGNDLAGMVKQLGELPLEFSPGERWNYSVATDVLGRLVEVISGKSLDVFFEQRILGPLGMHDTGFHVPVDRVDRFAALYDRAPDKSLRLIDDPTKSPSLGKPDLFSGGGGLVSTASDYHRFCRMLLEGGELDGARILGRKTIELMVCNHLPENQDLAHLATGSFSETTYNGIGFGLGFAQVIDRIAAQSNGSLGEYFWGGMASTVFWNDPVEDLTVIFMVQFMPSGTFNFRGQLRSIVYGALA